jgi:cation diffusion facilitator family transporter
VPSGSKRVVHAALAVNLSIALFKFVCAWLARSSAMAAEAAHSLADTGNQIFLLLGMHLAGRPEDERHPFGYGSENYFWSFVVAITLFTLGCAFSILEGVQKIQGDGQLRDVRWALVVLVGSMAMESYSFFQASRELGRMRKGRSILETIREARDPSVIIVLFEDSADLFGLANATAGILLAKGLNRPVFDGIASIVVGVALGVVAFLLARTTKSLLIGEGVTQAERDRMIEIISTAPLVHRLIHMRTLHLGPEEVMAALKVELDPNLTTRDVEHVIDEIERRIRAELPHVRRIYVEVGSEGRPSPGMPVPLGPALPEAPNIEDAGPTIKPSNMK